MIGFVGCDNGQPYFFCRYPVNAGEDPAFIYREAAMPVAAIAIHRLKNRFWANRRIDVVAVRQEAAEMSAAQEDDALGSDERCEMCNGRFVGNGQTGALQQGPGFDQCCLPGKIQTSGAKCARNCFSQRPVFGTTHDNAEQSGPLLQAKGDISETRHGPAPARVAGTRGDQKIVLIEAQSRPDSRVEIKADDPCFHSSKRPTEGSVLFGFVA